LKRRFWVRQSKHAARKNYALATHTTSANPKGASPEKRPLQDEEDLGQSH